ncbi:hypothetical protein [Xanthomonas citri]|uniref:hypothetical protein n=1 Tax=Xanthomonas citri TaxID=346 RepID=UPI0001CED397|nr:hypothetical protein [Xanthomonas citri]AMV00080.1 hypothetical protein TP37_19875 [Xanthomonas citri pv. aurantifolii]AMV02095.1 hypothetical protein TP50_06255 [Xanthomonas citri pv. aurantifolii]EFF47357.1 hypothetical protein XAUC_22490 [Xanthomonas citri pv. aurantifolii str. ICPB 10535]MCC8490859.1 hypothetical protein [Xanthomonas citri pv. fuscans]TBW97971.1 hypothetical protein TP47_09615 [Xanthomonas citri pv. aurantifolii]
MNVSTNHNTFDYAGLIQPIYKAIWKAGNSLLLLAELGNAGISQQGFRDRAVEIAISLRNAAGSARKRLSDAEEHRRQMASEGITVTSPSSTHLSLAIAKADEYADDILRDLDAEIAESYTESDFCGFEELAGSMAIVDPAKLVYMAITA